MHTKRVIPCLDVKDGRVVKGVNFVDLKDYLCEISSFNTKQYYSYFDKCCSSMLNSMLISTQNASEQKEYINHLCSQVISRMSIKDLINYLDINRIRKLLY